MIALSHGLINTSLRLFQYAFLRSHLFVFIPTTSTPSYKRNASNDFKTRPIEPVSARGREAASFCTIAIGWFTSVPSD